MYRLELQIELITFGLMALVGILTGSAERGVFDFGRGQNYLEPFQPGPRRG